MNLGRTLHVSNIVNTFVDGEVITGTGLDIVGGSNELTLEASGGVTADGNKYLIDIDGDGTGELYPSIPMTRKGIYTFDLSDVSVVSHPLRF